MPLIAWFSDADHPHGRGDGRAERSMYPWFDGSPPRAWGRQQVAGPILTVDRITPTGVGTAADIRRAGSTTPDHPHGRGDGSQSRPGATRCNGSPPRAWGRRMGTGLARCEQRITPTGVGTATRADPATGGNADHPHGRGDGPWRGSGADRGIGSPPRAWGRQGLELLPFLCGRITPTGVGTAASRTAREPANGDHPHGRGDGSITRSPRESVSGSPPRAWGRPTAIRPKLMSLRITPTGVGTAYKKEECSVNDSDHPHGRGDGLTVST